MSIEIEDDPRTEPPTRGDDRAMLAGFLRRQRETLELKCSDLDAEQLARRSVEPSSIPAPGGPSIAPMSSERGTSRRQR